MDSLSQAALGAAVCVAAMGPRTPVWKAAAWGAVCGTLPDLDALIDHGNAVLNVTSHRAESHALFWLTLAAVPIAWPIARIARERERLARWCLAVWLVLITHPLLDSMTIFGTRLALPFDDHPYGVGSVFIIDPLYTLPLAAGVVMALARRDARGHAWNRAGLALSTLYLAWSVVAQQQVRDDVHRTVDARAGAAVADSRILVTPTPFNTLLWRVVVMHDDYYEEGFRSLLDTGSTIRFERYPLDRELYRSVAHLPAAARLVQFTHGFLRVAEERGEIVMTDLRMGQHPYYAFSFAIARRDAGALHAADSRNVGGRQGMDVGASLTWLVRRALGRTTAPLAGR